MAEGIADNVRRLLEAVSFAGRAHQGQLRKDGRTPYASHPFRVCLIVRHVFGIDDPEALTAALLHDTIEDTPTDYDDLKERFGDAVAGWVGTLSKDMRHPEEEREEEYRAGLARAPWPVKVCKLADMCDNLLDSAHLRPDQRARTIRRTHAYLEALASPDLPPAVRRAWELVRDLANSL